MQQVVKLEDRIVNEIIYATKTILNDAHINEL